MSNNDEPSLLQRLMVAIDDLISFADSLRDRNPAKRAGLSDFAAEAEAPRKASGSALSKSAELLDKFDHHDREVFAICKRLGWEIPLGGATERERGFTRLSIASDATCSRRAKEKWKQRILGLRRQAEIELETSDVARERPSLHAGDDDIERWVNEEAEVDQARLDEEAYIAKYKRLRDTWRVASEELFSVSRYGKKPGANFWDEHGNDYAGFVAECVCANGRLLVDDGWVDLLDRVNPKKNTNDGKKLLKRAVDILKHGIAGDRGGIISSISALSAAPRRRNELLTILDRHVRDELLRNAYEQQRKPLKPDVDQNATAITASSKDLPEHAEKERGPCYDRNRLWLDWHENEGLGPARILDRWNAMSDDDRKSRSKRCWDLIVDTNECGERKGKARANARDLVKKALAAAKRDQGN